METYRRGELTFEVLDSGPADGPPVVLLHGFPQFNTSWEPVMERLVTQGYRCLAPNQRGYSPGARPPRRRDYRMPYLAADVIALIDELGGGPVHVVGHDLGAAVAWQLAAMAPEKVASLTVISVPHPVAFKKALLTSRQGLSSWYMYVLQLPRLPERVLRRGGGRGLARLLGGQTPEFAERDGRAMVETGALTSAINWYRAFPLTPPAAGPGRSTVPTLLIWSDGDAFVKEAGVLKNAPYVTADYRLEILRGVSHWIPDECPERAAELIGEWIGAHPIPAS